MNCAAARGSIPCPFQVQGFELFDRIPVETLELACAPICAAGLAKYEADIVAACGPEDVFFRGLESVGTPVTWWAQ